MGSRSGGQGLGRGQGLGVKVVVKVMGSRSWGQGHGVKVRVMISGHKVRGQGRWSRSGYRSWGQVGEGSRSGVQVRGQGLGRGQGRGEGCGQGRGSRSGVKVRVMISGHKVVGQGQGSECQGSRSGEWSGGGVKVWQIGVRWSVGEIGDKQSVPFKNS